MHLLLTAQHSRLIDVLFRIIVETGVTYGVEAKGASACHADTNHDLHAPLVVAEYPYIFLLVLFPTNTGASADGDEGSSMATGVTYGDKAKGASECHAGTESVSQAECAKQGRVNTGYWNHVPPGCSVQGDAGAYHSPHFNTKSTGIDYGAYFTPVCIGVKKRGRATVHFGEGGGGPSTSIYLNDRLIATANGAAGGPLDGKATNPHAPPFIGALYPLSNNTPPHTHTTTTTTTHTHTHTHTHTYTYRPSTRTGGRLSVEIGCTGDLDCTTLPVHPQHPTHPHHVCVQFGQKYC